MCPGCYADTGTTVLIEVREPPPRRVNRDAYVSLMQQPPRPR